MKPDAPLRLLVRLLHRDEAGVGRCLRAHAGALDELVAAAAAGGLATVLLRALDANAMTSALSAAQRETLAHRRDRQWARHAVLIDGLGQLAAAFGAVDLPFMLLKGPHLAARFYGDPQAREFVDLDLLVRRADRARASALLVRAGYARRSRHLGGAALTAFFVHGFDYHAGGVNVDLHWGLSRHPSLAIDEALVWQRAGAFAVAGRTCTVPADEDLVTLTALGLLRDIERGRPKRKNVVDLTTIVTAMDAHTAWDAMLARAVGEGTHGPLVNVLALALDAADARDLAPRLAAALDAHAARRVPLPPGSPLAAGATSRARIANRVWAARAHDTAFATWLGWSLVSLPFRRAAHGWPRPTLPPRETG